MKNLKSVLCVLLTIGILLLSACVGSAPQQQNEQPASQPKPESSAEQSSEPVEISFLHCFSGAYAELYSEFAEEFNEQNSGKYIVTMIPVDGSYEGVLERVQLLSLSNNLPDIVNGGHHFLHYMIESFPYVPVQKFIDSEGYDTSDFFPGMLDLGRAPSGELAALVFGVSTPIIIYNKELLEANGVTDPPRTFDEVREVAKKVTNDEQYGIYVNIEQPGLWIIQSLIENYGEKMVNDESTGVGYDEAGLKAFEFLNNLVNEDKTMPLPFSDTTGGGMQGAVDMFKSGKLGMVITSTGQLGNLSSDVPFTVLSAPFPSEDGNFHSVPGGGNSNLILAQDPEKQQGAWEFLKYISLPEQATRISQVFGYMVVSQEAFNTPELMGNYLDEHQAARSTYEQVPYMSLWLNFPGSSGTKYVQVTQDNIAAMLQGEKTSEQANKDTIAQLNEIIAQG